ncbi:MULTISPECIES: TAXI family TRAP transporter solute-binding subunit [Pseudomonas]|jgi:TRAP transporter TAXI family solute receptor|uniref:TAXI family TRAP transporter solute-binding subunit n=1 Tax=Pseudomonas spirodelae TaxID=3101751 RepID=A0ABU5P5F3_9PSED|nr:MULTISPECIES: TAXI family TRAP transporter solute-binding subunit [unclassified Pseudomonas]MBU0807827.1 TAXI family TRAP transporter solute-binding subunit [Gammaproteobacteria bacterium]MBU0885251.1 TAXI family TRAP transporter solute-binding subunit [Gammaproteobacteria bacterium]MBU0902028.1 TAXI family TRAP transporter solute-binding subunit [Gammaproteobacteria bacterium]MBU1858679.1 TAXI family TRAP transporter solute-binding subunit [Gammaproteobacteria bacterium]MDD2160202.1 TAXI f
MKGKSLAWALSAALAGITLSSAVQAEEQFVTIGTGGQTGVYYVAGQSICRFLNRGAADHGIKCNAPASGGGVANVNGIRSGEFNFGIMQSDHQFKAMKGVTPFEKEGAMDDIRAVFSLQSEVFTILARRDANIASFDDLKGKRVNIGNPGSGQRDTLEEIMQVKGWDRSAFSLAAELKPAEQASALGDNNIDAMTYFVGHPNGAIQEATTTTDAVLVPVTGAEIDKLLAAKSYYTKAEIPGGVYKGNDAPTPSIGGKAVLSTSAKASPEVVYQLVKSVFDNIDRFKRLHPAFADLKEADMIKVGLSAPLHEGAVRYYKERGWL